jgi:hypothetical protein
LQKLRYMEPIGDQTTKKYTYMTWRCLLTLIWLIGAGLMVNACDHSNADPTPSSETKENNQMQSTTATSTIRPLIPPLDDSQPQVISTATFALG